MRKFHCYEGPYVILFHMMKYAINNNFKYFNFFGTSKDFESEEATDTEFFSLNVTSMET